MESYEIKNQLRILADGLRTENADRAKQDRSFDAAEKLVEQILCDLHTIAEACFQIAQRIK